MIYKFHSAVAGEVIMLEENAEQVLDAIGKPPGARGVIPASDLPAAIAALQTAMQRSEQQHGKTADKEEGVSAIDRPVPFHVRAHPFLKLLQVSQEHHKDVTWGI